MAHPDAKTDDEGFQSHSSNSSVGDLSFARGGLAPPKTGDTVGDLERGVRPRERLFLRADGATQLAFALAPTASQ